MKKLRFKLPVVIFLLICIVSLSACSGKTISSDYDKEEVKSKAEDVIHLVNDKNSSELKAMGTQELRDALTEDVLNQVYSAIESAGTFKDIEDISVAGQVDKDTNEEFAIVAAKANYENRTFIYTITFNKQLELVGLFYR